MKVHMETKNSQNSLEKEQQNWRTHMCQLQNLIQTYSNQDRVILAQR